MFTASTEDIDALELLAVELELSRAVSIVGSVIPQVASEVGGCSTSREQGELSKDAIALGRTDSRHGVVRAPGILDEAQEYASLVWREKTVQPQLLFHHVPPHDTIVPSRARGSTVIDPWRSPR